MIDDDVHIPSSRAGVSRVAPMRGSSVNPFSNLVIGMTRINVGGLAHSWPAPHRFARARSSHEERRRSHGEVSECRDCLPTGSRPIEPHCTRDIRRRRPQGRHGGIPGVRGDMAVDARGADTPAPSRQSCKTAVHGRNCNCKSPGLVGPAICDHDRFNGATRMFSAIVRPISSSPVANNIDDCVDAWSTELV